MGEAVPAERAPQPGELAVKTVCEGETLVLSLAGEIDLASAAVLESALHEAEEQRPPRLVIDLAGVGFMDSTGLRVLLAANRRADSADRRLVLRPGSPWVQRLFEVSGLLGELRFDGS